MAGREEWRRWLWVGGVGSGTADKTFIRHAIKVFNYCFLNCCLVYTSFEWLATLVRRAENKQQNKRKKRIFGKWQQQQQKQKRRKKTTMKTWTKAFNFSFFFAFARWRRLSLKWTGKEREKRRERERGRHLKWHCEVIDELAKAAA